MATSSKTMTVHCSGGGGDAAATCEDGSLDEKKYLYLIVRKPQEGKTFICLKDIEQSAGMLHVIVTMNTIKSSNQFMSRAEEKFGKEICTLNSKSKTKDALAAHQDIIKKKKNIVIMCAHPTRFNNSIISLLELLDDSIRFGRKIRIHIDEAHAYVPAFREKIIQMNTFPVIDRIILYSATPFPIWDDVDSLFRNLYVININEQYEIRKSEEYYGVKDCLFEIGFADEQTEYDTGIPGDFISRWGNEKQKKLLENRRTNNWYSGAYPFQIGNEISYINYVEKTLPKLNEIISNESYSLNFIPAYLRKLTHYKIMELVLDHFDRAVVVVVNGDGTRVFYNGRDVSSKIKQSYFPPEENEPSQQLENIIKEFPNRPVFITGFHCVSMSVTLISENTGNFDTVIMAHEQYISTPEVLYQLCRFVFNYISWKKESKLKIKKTKLFVKNDESFRICIDYEKQIEKIDAELSGSLRTKQEVIGEVPIKKRKEPKEITQKPLEPFSTVHKLKTFRVEEGDDPMDVLKKVKLFYKSFVGNLPTEKSIPKLEDGFYKCSTTKSAEIQEGVDKLKAWLKSIKFDSNLALKEGRYKYARIYVAYDDKTDNSEYTWIIRRMEIKECEEVTQIWRDINSK